MPKLRKSLQIDSSPERPVLVLALDDDRLFRITACRGDKLLNDVTDGAAHQITPQQIIFTTHQSLEDLRKATQVPCIAAKLYGVAAKVIGCGVVDQAPGKDYAAVYRCGSPKKAAQEIILKGAHRPGAVRILNSEDWIPRMGL